MKKIKYTLSYFATFIFLFTTNCKTDEPKVSAKDELGAKLSGTWTVDETKSNSVMFESENRTVSFKDFTLVLTYSAAIGSGTYTTASGPEGETPFASTGTWKFKNVVTDANATDFIIIRDDGLEITISSVTKSDMALKFVLDSSNSSSKIGGIVGNWTFDLIAE